MVIEVKTIHVPIQSQKVLLLNFQMKSVIAVIKH